MEDAREGGPVGQGDLDGLADEVKGEPEEAVTEQGGRLKVGRLGHHGAGAGHARGSGRGRRRLAARGHKDTEP